MWGHRCEVTTSVASNSGRGRQHEPEGELPTHKSQCLQQLHIGASKTDVQAEREREDRIVERLGNVVWISDGTTSGRHRRQ